MKLSLSLLFATSMTVLGGDATKDVHSNGSQQNLLQHARRVQGGYWYGGGGGGGRGAGGGGEQENWWLADFSIKMVS
jgi:hypothetical protein